MISDFHQKSIEKRFPKAWEEFKKTGVELTFINLKEFYTNKGETSKYYAIALSKIEYEGN